MKRELFLSLIFIALILDINYKNIEQASNQCKVKLQVNTINYNNVMSKTAGMPRCKTEVVGFKYNNTVNLLDHPNNDNNNIVGLN